MASKRKRDEVFQGSADDAVPHGRPPRATQEIVTYFEELRSHFDNLDDREEQSLLVANALEEASGQECAVATDAGCSRVLEVLLPSAEPQQLAKFFQAVLDGEGLMGTASRYFTKSLLWHLAIKADAIICNRQQLLLPDHTACGAAVHLAPMSWRCCLCS